MASPLLSVFLLQLEALDLLNCLIAPLFFANALSRWWDHEILGILAATYCAVLLLKGYQLGLLLLPEAHRVHAHRKARCAETGHHQCQQFGSASMFQAQLETALL